MSSFIIPAFGGFRLRLNVLHASSLILLLAARANACEAPQAESLLPKSTKAVVSAPNFARLEANWGKTQFARLFDDPAMQPFGRDLRRQVEEKWLSTKPRLGLTYDDFRALAAGELTIAVVPNADGHAAQVALIDVAGHEATARATVEKLVAELVRRGGKRSQRKVAGATLEVVTSPPSKPKGVPRTAAYALHDGLFLSTDDAAVAEQLVERLAEPSNERVGDALGDLAAFQAVMARCGEGKGLLPDIRWYVEPLGLAAALGPQRRPRRGHRNEYVELLANQGFDAVQAIGGHLNFGVDGCALVHRTFAFAPPPHELAMRMVVLPNGDGLAPPAWTPPDATSYTALRCDLTNAFDHAGTLVDELNGIEGLFDDTLESIENDTGLDLRRDLLAHLGERITIVSENKLPITPASQRRLLAIEAKTPDALRAMLAKSFDGDPRVTRRVLGEHEIWELSPEDDDEPVEPVVPLRSRRAAGAARNGAVRPADDVRTELPDSLIALAHGQLFISTDEALLAKALAAPGEGRSLAAEADCRAVLAECTRLGAKQPCAMGFSRSDEARRLSYELFQRGKLRESDTFLSSLLGLFSDDSKGRGPPTQQFDGHKLPQFDMVRRYFGASGGFAVSEPNGWYVVGFDLECESPLAAAR
ncbi:MAG TPA: hypothetical protein VGX78_22700 [Pirellulales bacterium]|jgi:hypothetical protein|nr:hypothetical protein [Pirellulales bacterium]